MERANRRLSSTETFTVTPSRHLAHYVAGLLAATRRDVSVRLQPSPIQGATAVVDFPAALILKRTNNIHLDRPLPCGTSPGTRPGSSGSTRNRRTS